MSEENRTMSTGNTRLPEDEKRNERRKWVIRGAILSILILVIFLSLDKGGDSGNQIALGPGVIIGTGVKAGEMDKGGENENQESSRNGKSEMTVRMNGYPVFADGGSEGNLNIENPAVNELHMNVEITLDSTGEVIYDSGTIPPEHYIDSDRLTKNLEKGKYEVTAHVTLLDPEHPDANYNSANFALVMTIEN